MMFLSVCERCSGSMEYTGEGDLHCLSCGRYVYSMNTARYHHPLPKISPIPQGELRLKWRNKHA